MDSFSVIIVGAGPGGLACATLLAGHGLDVLVLEKKPVPGPKVCGGGITWRGLIQRVPESLVDKLDDYMDDKGIYDDENTSDDAEDIMETVFYGIVDA